MDHSSPVFSHRSHSVRINTCLGPWHCECSVVWYIKALSNILEESIQPWAKLNYLQIEVMLRNILINLKLVAERATLINWPASCGSPSTSRNSNPLFSIHDLNFRCVAIAQLWPNDFNLWQSAMSITNFGAFVRSSVFHIVASGLSRVEPCRANLRFSPDFNMRGAEMKHERRLSKSNPPKTIFDGQLVKWILAESMGRCIKSQWMSFCGSPPRNEPSDDCFKSAILTTPPRQGVLSMSFKYALARSHPPHPG